MTIDEKLDAINELLLQISKMIQSELKINNELLKTCGENVVKKKDEKERREKESNKEREKREKEKEETNKFLLNNHKEVITIISNINDNVNKLCSNSINRGKKENFGQIRLLDAPIKTNLSREDLFEISLSSNVSYLEVKEIYKELKEKYEAGMVKRPIKDFKATLKVWVRNAKKFGYVVEMDEIGRVINQHYSPQAVATEIIQHEKEVKEGSL